MSAPLQQPTDFPLAQLTFHLSEGYSLACRHCQMTDWPATSSETGSAVYLPARAVEQALYEALPLGLRAVRLSGSQAPRGDVLLHPEIDALLDRLESLELRVEVETNGTGLTPERAKRLARLPQCEVVIGLDGASASAHDALHLPGAFEIATGAARQLAQLGLAPRMIYSVLRSNARQLPAAVRLAGELGARSLRFIPAHPGRPNPARPQPGQTIINLNGGAPSHPNGNGNGSGKTETLNGCGLPNPARAGTAPLTMRRTTGALGGAWSLLGPQSIYLRVEELIALGRKVERELTHNAPLPLVFDQPPAFRGLNASGRIEGQGRCTILNSLSVLPDGRYTLCGAASAGAGMDLVFGKVAADSLGRIWRENPTLRLLRERMPDQLEGVCGRCLMKNTCLGYCAAENYHNTGDFWSPYWFCEAAEQAGLFPASRLIENSW